MNVRTCYRGYRATAAMLVLLGSLLSVGGSVQAAANDRKTCVAISKAEASIAACQRLLKSGGLDRRNRSIVHSNICAALNKLKQHKKAQATCKKAIKLNAKNFRAHANLALALNGTKAYREALAAAEASLRLKKNYTHARFQKARAQTGLGKNQSAIETYTRILKLNPKDSASYNNRGDVYLSLKNTKKAMADFERAVKIAPGKKLYLRNLGRANVAAGELRHAIAQFGMALRQDKTYVAALMDRADAYMALASNYAHYFVAKREAKDFKEYQKKYYNKARDDYEAVVRLNPKNTAAYIELAQIDAKSGNHHNAITNFDMVIRLDPRLVEAYRGRAASKLVLSDLAGAIDDIRNALKLIPDRKKRRNGIIGIRLSGVKDGILVHGVIPDRDAEAKGLRPGDIVLAVNETGLAGLSLDDAILKLSGPVDSEAKLRVRRRGRERTIVVQRSGMWIDAKRAELLKWLGDVYAKKGELNESVGYYGLALKEDPSFNAARLARGLVYGSSGKLTLAVEDFARAIDVTKLKWRKEEKVLEQLAQPDSQQIIAKAIEANPENATALWTRAQTHRDNYTKVKDLGKLVKLAPGDLRYREFRALLLRKEGRCARALLDFDILLREKPADHILRHKRAVCRHKVHDYEGAITDFDRLLSYPDTTSRAVYLEGRAAAYAKKGEFENSVAEYTQLIAETKKHHHRANMYFSRGIIYRTAGRVDEAIADYTKALEEAVAFIGKRSNSKPPPLEKLVLEPSHGFLRTVLQARARLHSASGDTKSAIADLKLLIKFKADTEVLFERARAHQIAGNNEAAVRDYKTLFEKKSAFSKDRFIQFHARKRLIELGQNPIKPGFKESSEICEVRGISDAEFQKYQLESCTVVASSSSLPVSTSARAKLRQAYLHLELDAYKKSIKAFQAALKLMDEGNLPNERATATVALAVAHFKSGAIDAARDALGAVSLASESSPYELNLRAWLLLKEGKPRDALPLIERALKENPDFPYFLDTKGQILAALGRHSEARVELKLALRTAAILPDGPDKEEVIAESKATLESLE